MSKLKGKFRHISPHLRKSVPLRQVFLTWDLTYGCNYTCSYCSLGSGRERENKPKTVILSPEKWRTIWEDVYGRYGACHIHFTGGEPFIYPGFMEILEMIAGMHTFESSTNLFWDVGRFIDIVKPSRARIGASYHPEMTSFESFSGKVRRLKESGYEVWTNYVAYPPFLEDLERAGKAFKEMGVNMSILPFNGRYGEKEYPDSYSPQERRHLERLGASLPWVKKTIDFAFGEGPGETTQGESGKRCWMGAVYAKIFPDGKVTACCAENAAELGNIIEGTFELRSAPSDCPAESCPCWKSMVLGREEHWTPHWPLPPAEEEKEIE